MIQVKLVARTHCGLEALKTHGEIWDVIMTREEMLQVRSQRQTFKKWNPDPQAPIESMYDVRWVDILNDGNFFIEPYTGGDL